ncbi:ribonuclease H-like domain-containing protein, partial [Tanacetum coccineum]
RSLYELKQAHRAWFQRFVGYALRVGFTSSRCDSSLFIYLTGTEFDMTDLEAFNYFLRISVIRDARGMFLSQKKYDMELLERAHMSNSKCQVTCLVQYDSEYRGVANVVAETAWIRNLLRELHTPLFTATLVYCNNVSAVYMSTNPVQHQRTKHIEIDIHFVRDMVALGEVRVLHVPSRYQYADIFTKGLATALFEEFHTSLSVRSPPAQTAGEC